MRYWHRPLTEWHYFLSRRGRFSVVRNVRLRDDVCGGARGGGRARVAKVIAYSEARRAECLREYDMLRGVRQQNIVRMRETFVHDDCVILILDKLYGENVARSLSLKNRYSEYHVTSVIKQVSGSVGRWVGGLVGRWVGGSVDRWVGGSVGRWVVRVGGSVGRWVGGLVGRWVGGSVGCEGRWVGGSVGRWVSGS